MVKVRAQKPLEFEKLVGPLLVSVGEHSFSSGAPNYVFISCNPNMNIV